MPEGNYPLEMERFQKKASSLIEDRKFGEAIEAISLFISIYPDSYVGYWQKAICYSRMNLLRDAIDAIGRAVRLVSDNGSASHSVKFSASRLYLKAGLLDEAIPLLEYCRKHKSFTEDADWFLTEIYVKLRDQQRAKETLQRLPADFERLHMLGRPRTTRALLEAEVANINKYIR